MHPEAWFAEELERLDVAGLRRTLTAVDGMQDARVSIEGRSFLSLCSNNYLGLANHPALIEAAVRAARDQGVGAGASRLVSGSMRSHHDLEERLAEFKRTEGCLLFTSGYQANVGTITSLVGEEDAVFSDALNHASLIDGCRLSRARVHVYPHRDLGMLADALSRSVARRRLIVTDSIFSMDGDAAPLEGICELAERHGAMVLVDEAHATGVLGKRGAGLVEELGLGGRVTAQMGTLGKAFGAFGAYVAGSRDLVSLLVNRARTFVYTTALPPPLVAAAAAALEIVRDETWRRDAVRRNAVQLRRDLASLGYHVGGPEDGHILPVLIGDTATTMRLAEGLYAAGILARGIRPPTVPEGTARIRATVMATHTAADIDAAVEAFAQARAPGSAAAMSS